MMRLAKIKQWAPRWKELCPAKRKLHETMLAHVRKVLQGKQLLLLAECLKGIGYEDKGLLNEMQEGYHSIRGKVIRRCEARRSSLL